MGEGGSKIVKIETILFMDDPYLEHHMAGFNGTTRRSKVRGLGDKKGQNFFLIYFDRLWGQMSNKNLV